MNDNVAWGIVTISFCIAGYIFAFRNEQQGNNGLALSLLVICGFCLRVYCSWDSFLHMWDERYHALVAKHLLLHWLKPTLYEHPVLPYDYANFTNCSIWVHKQPLTLWLIALSLKIFGIHAWVVRVPSIIMSTLGIKLIYDIATFLYDKKIAFISAFLFSIHGLIIEISSGRVATDHVDLAFLFFVLLCVWFAVKNAEHKSYGYALLLGASLGCAILCKWLPALIVIPVWLCIYYKNDPHLKSAVLNLGLIIIAALIVALPWQLYSLHEFPTEARWEYKYNSMHIFQVLADQGGSFFYHFDYLRMNFGELIYLSIIWFTIIGIRKQQLYDIALLFWFWLPYLFFTFCATKMQGYTLFAAPAIFIITARAYFYFRELYHQKQKMKWLYIVLAYGFILLPVRYCIERVKPFNNDYVRHPKWQKQFDDYKKTPANSPSTIVFNCEHYVEMMFETECTAYKEMPDTATISQLKSKGFTIITWKND